MVKILRLNSMTARTHSFIAIRSTSKCHGLNVANCSFNYDVINSRRPSQWSFASHAEGDQRLIKGDGEIGTKET